MGNKNMKIAMVTPWGVSLLEKELKNWMEVDVYKFMELHTMIVVKDGKKYRFNITPIGNEQ